MTRSILSVAYALATVGQGAVGGAEQVLSTLDHALVRSGATSIVVASRGSQACGTLHPGVTLPERFDAATLTRAVDAQRAAITRAFDETSIDLVHFHGLDFDRYLDVVPPRVPILVTLHLPIGWYSPSALTQRRAGVYLHCVSDAQRRSASPAIALLATIPNGVAITDTVPRRRQCDGGAVALGRICPEKGYHFALDAARAAGVELRLAGRVFGYPAHLEYHAREIEPRLDARRRYIGPVGRDDKWTLLGEASCLLVPSLAPETSSLVAMEALACGTPVIAFANGALPEIVRDGETGFIVHDADAMARAIDAVRRGEIDRQACWRAAREHFDASAMIQRYFDTYEQIITGGPSMLPSVA
jgi:glycosyltransferase involved in cell wall biosynthesis